MAFKPTYNIAHYLLYGLAFALMICIAGAGLLNIYSSYKQQESVFRRSMNNSAYQAQVYFDQRETLLRRTAAAPYPVLDEQSCLQAYGMSTVLQDADQKLWCLPLNDREQMMLDLYQASLLLIQPSAAEVRYIGSKQSVDQSLQANLRAFVAEHLSTANEGSLAPVYWHYTNDLPTPSLYLLVPVWPESPGQAWLAMELSGFTQVLPSFTVDRTLGRLTPNYLLLTPDLLMVDKNGVLQQGRLADLSSLMPQQEDRFQLLWQDYLPTYLYLRKSFGDDGWSMVFYVRFKDILHYGVLPITSTLLAVLIGCLLVLAAVWQIRLRLLLPAAQHYLALQENERLTRTIIETASIGLCLVESNGRPVVANQPAMQWLEGEEISFVLSLANGQVRDQLRQLKDGRSVSVTAEPILFQGKQIAVCAITDVSKFIEIERSLRQAKQKAVAESQAKSEFLATMSHEIRTPLFGIMGTLELLGITELSALQQQYLETANHSSDLLLRTINEILTLSRLEAGKEEAVEQEYCPSDVVHSVLAMYADRARLQNLLLYAVVSPEVPAKVKGDELRTRQILNNLVSNALKFTQGGQVVVRLESQITPEHGLELLFQVTDTGIGMSEEVQRRVFTAYQSAQGGVVPNSSGLGLFICKRLADLMRGELKVVSREGLGTSVYLRLPVQIASFQAPPALPPARVFVQGRVPEQVKNLCAWLQSWGLLAMPYKPGDEAYANGAVLLHAWPNSALKVNWSGRQVHMLPSGYQTIDLESPHSEIVKAYDLPQLYHVFQRLLTGEQPVEVVSTVDKRDVAQGVAVLVVDDNEINRRILAEQLEHLGCIVYLANDGQQALVRLSEHSIDFVLTDINMPKMGGIELVQHMRQQACKIPVYGVTAAVGDEVVQQAIEVGMDDLLSRPLSMATLDNILRRFL